MLATLLLLMLEIPGSPGGGVPREALEIVWVGAEVGVGAGAETEEKKVAKRRMPNEHQCQRRKRRRQERRRRKVQPLR